MTPELEALLERIEREVEARRPPGGMRTRIVAIDGPGGAGKSTLAGHLASRLGDAPIVHTDDFASWDNPVDWWPRLVEEVLEPLFRGEAARFRRSAWEPGQDRGFAKVRPSRFVILEGVTASREAFRPYLTYAVWIDAERKTRLARGLARDGEAARGSWEEWMAAEDRYRERERPDRRADLVVRGDRDLWR